MQIAAHRCRSSPTTQTREPQQATDPLDVILTAAVEAGGRVPRATYRVQLNQQFTFDAAAEQVAYLDMLGISDLYASPYLAARPESTHGYDVIDHSRLNPAVGSEQSHRAMIAALHQFGMGHVLDVVPNHMGIGSSNQWWLDVLENGPAARRATAFDIDWHPLKPELAGKVLLPILGGQYGIVLENAELKLSFTDGAFTIRYWDHVLPVDPSTYPDLLRYHLDRLIEQVGADDDAVLELQSIITGATNLPGREARAPERLAERQREKEILKRRLGTLAARSTPIQSYIDQVIAVYNGARGVPASFDLLDALIGRQAYRLSFWRVAAEEINYRRFFEINDLAAIRVELPEVFRDSHQLIIKLLRDGAIDGLRVDHVDGLWDPEEYAIRLHAATLVARFGDPPPLDGPCQDLEDTLAERLRAEPSGPATRLLWLVVEKILASGEPLPESWPVAGTTGYEFANAVAGLFVDPANRRAFDEIYTRFTGLRLNFRDVAYDCKQLIMDTAMASELNVLGHHLSRLAQRNRRTRDFTVNSLTDALREVVACFPVYRTYITTRTETVEQRDRSVIETAVSRAMQRNPAVDTSVFEFVRDTLLLTGVEGDTDDDRAARRAFVMKLQQYTGPVTAKGVEDTAFYRYNRLIGLNEVGGEPDQFGTTVTLFHRQNSVRLRQRPATMISTSTHDTKRGEDARVRISVLSEIPREWRAAINRWRRANRKHRIQVDGVSAPDANEEYCFYQALVGAWPAEPIDRRQKQAFSRRMQQYMLKAAKEAKVNTSWVNPEGPYDEAIQQFVARVLADRDDSPFMRDFLVFQRRIARLGMVNSLSQVVLKLTAPGVPDIYQGAEFWDLSLVDPDNRRPVDYARRAAALKQLRAITDGERPDSARALLEQWPDARIKLYVLHRALELRREQPELFTRGGYIALAADGSHAEQICASRRHLDGVEAITIVPRLISRLCREPDGLPLGTAWSDTRLRLPDSRPGCRYRDYLTGAELVVEEQAGGPVLPLAAVFETLPVALLVREQGERGSGEREAGSG